MEPQAPHHAKAARKASGTPHELPTREGPPTGPPAARNDANRISACGPPQAVPATDPDDVTWGLAGHLNKIKTGVSPRSLSGEGGPSSSTARPNNSNRAPKSSQPWASSATVQTFMAGSSAIPIDPRTARPSTTQAAPATTLGQKQPKLSPPSEAGPSNKRRAVEPQSSSAGSSSVSASVTKTQQTMLPAPYKGCLCYNKMPTTGVPVTGRLKIEWQQGEKVVKPGAELRVILRDPYCHTKWLVRIHEQNEGNSKVFIKSEEYRVGGVTTDRNSGRAGEKKSPDPYSPGWAATRQFSAPKKPGKYEIRFSAGEPHSACFADPVLFEVAPSPPAPSGQS